MKKLQIVLLSVLAATGYGIVHDEITARLCLEYFTIAHPALFHTTSITLLALCWGVVATAGLGAILGFVLALVSQSGEGRRVPVPRLARSILLLIATMGVSAAVAGFVGFELAHAGMISIPADVARVIPVTRHDLFIAVWFAHCASYLVGIMGGAFLCYRVWVGRGRPAVITIFPRTRTALLRTFLLAGIVAGAVWFRFFGH